MAATAQSLVALGFAQVLAVLFLGPLFEGFVRKYIRAQIAHSRRGPLVGIWQPFVDLGKLFVKEDVEVGGGLQRLAPILCLGGTLCAATLVPMAGIAPLGTGGDFIVFVYVLGIGAVAMVLGGLASISPYAYAGATREMMLFLIVEPVLVIALVTAAVSSHSLAFADMVLWYRTNGVTLAMALAGLAFLVATLAQFGKLPFDIPEAEQEIMGGPFIEMSGPKLALFKWAIWARQFVVASLFVSVFAPWPHVASIPLAMAITVLKTLFVFILIGLVDVVNPRLRVDQALAFYLGVIILAAMSVALAIVTV